MLISFVSSILWDALFIPLLKASFSLFSVSFTKERCYNSNTLCCSTFSNCVKILFMWQWHTVPAIVGSGVRRRPVDRRMGDLRKCGDSVCLSVQLCLVVFIHFENYLSVLLVLS